MTDAKGPQQDLPTGVDRPWWGAAPQGLPWAELFVPLHGRDGEVWTSADQLADPIFLAQGRVEVEIDGPLSSYRLVVAEAGDVFGGIDALVERAGPDLPQLQALRARAICRGPVVAWRLPLRRALFEADLGPLVESLTDHLLAAFLRPEVVRILERVLGWPGLHSIPLHRLVAGLPVQVVQAQHRLAVDPDHLPVILRGTLTEEGGEGRVLRAVRGDGSLDWWRGQVGPRTWMAAERTALVTLGREEVRAAAREMARQDADPGYRTLRQSPRWQRMPSDLPVDAIFAPMQVPAGTVFARSPRSGWIPGDPQGAVFFVLEGEVRVEHGSPQGRTATRRVGPGAWLGGTAWLDAAVELQRLPETHGYAFEAQALTEVRVLVARPQAGSLPGLAESLTRLVRERLLVEVLRERMVEALRRAGALGDLPPEVMSAALDRSRLVRLARGAVLEPPRDEFHLFLKGELVRTPGREDHRRLGAPEPFSVLGMTEFLHGWAPVGAWEAESTCWLLRFPKAELSGVKALRRLLREEGGVEAPVFDKAGGAEIVLLHGPEVEGALPGLADLLGQAIAEDFHDPILVVRLPRGTPPAVIDVVPQDDVTPARVELPLPDGDPRPALIERLRDWNRRFAWIVLVPVGRDPAFLRSLALLVERLVLVSRDASTPAALPVTADTAVLHALLLGPEGARAAGAAPPDLPDGAVRLRIPELLGRLSGGAAAPALASLPPDDRARIHRLARAVTERRVALALGGGGAWGYVHVALLLELKARGVPIDMVSGSSFGSVVGALYSTAGVKGLELLVAVGPSFSWTMPMNYVSTGALGLVIEGLLRAAAGLRGQAPLPIPWAERAMTEAEARQVLLAAGFDRRRVTRSPLAWLHELQGRPGPRLEDLEIPFFPVATDLDTGAEVVLESGPVSLGVRASGSFPGIFSSTPHPVDGRPLVDGGIASNVPDRVLTRQGAALVIASNPVPPPRRADLQGNLLDRLPLLRRVPQGARSLYIMMHSLGQKDRRVVGAAYNSPPVEHGMTQVELSRAIVHQAYAQDEFRDAISQAHSSWRRLARPRGLDVRAEATARGEQWTDLARTGWALVLPRGRGRDSARYRALAPLLELRRAQATRRDPRLYRELLGDEGMGPDESLAAFLARVGALPDRVEPERLPYHVLIVASPEEIPLEPQVALDVAYAVGRLWLADEVALAAYARRVVEAEQAGAVFRPRLRLVGVDQGLPQDRRLRELLVEPMRVRLAPAVPGWRVDAERLEVDRDDGDVGERVARQRLARLLQGIEAPDLLFLGGATAGFGAAGPAVAGSLRLGAGPPADAAELATAEPLGPRMAMVYGSFTGGWQARSPFAWTEAGAAVPDQPHDGLARFSQQLLEHPGGGLLAVMGKLDLAWVAPGLRPTSPEAAALAGVLELLMRGRTAGAAMQAMSDYFRLESGLLADQEGKLSAAEVERTRVCAVNARSWLLLGDPAVRLATG